MNFASEGTTIVAPDEYGTTTDFFFFYARIKIRAGLLLGHIGEIIHAFSASDRLIEII